VQWGRGGRACSEAGPAAPSAASTAASSAAPAEAAAAAAAAPAEAAAAAAVPAAVPAAAATAAAAAAAPAAATATTKAAPTLAAAAAPALAAAAMAFATTAMAFAALAAAAALATAVRRGEDLLWRRRRWLAPLVLVDAPLLALDRAVVVGAPVPLGDARRGAAVPRWRLRAGCCGHVRVTPLGTVAVALVRHLLALALLAAVIHVLLEPPRRRSRRLLLLLRRCPSAHRHGHVGLVRGGEAALRVSQRRARQASR
jgi:hypothetical protein